MSDHPPNRKQAKAFAASAGPPPPHLQQMIAPAPMLHAIPGPSVPIAPTANVTPGGRKRKAAEIGLSSAPPSSTIMAPGATMVPNLGSSHPLPPPFDVNDSSAIGASDTGEASTGTATKKSRTNTPWTPAEERRLKQMRDGGSTWSEIAKTFPTRTEGSVKKHWYKDMHYADFAEDESAALLAAIKEYETNKWKVIGQKVGKPAKACEQYAKENFTGKL